MPRTNLSLLSTESTAVYELRWATSSDPKQRARLDPTSAYGISFRNAPRCVQPVTRARSGVGAAGKRVHWASTVLAKSAEELRSVDSQRAQAFAAEAERVAYLMDAAGEGRVSRRGAGT